MYVVLTALKYVRFHNVSTMTNISVMESNIVLLKYMKPDKAISVAAITLNNTHVMHGNN